MTVGTKVACPVFFLLLNVALGRVSFLTHWAAALFQLHHDHRVTTPVATHTLGGAKWRMFSMWVLGKRVVTEFFTVEGLSPIQIQRCLRSIHGDASSVR